MNKVEILEHINRLPVAEQVELVESVLHDLGTRLRQSKLIGPKDKETLRQQMAEAAHEAAAYYRTDPEADLWRGLEGEPFHEYEEGTDLAGGSDADHRRGNDEKPTSPDR